MQGLLTLNRQYSPGQEVVCCLGGGDGRGFHADGRFHLPVSRGIFSVLPPAPAPSTASVRIERLSTRHRPAVAAPPDGTPRQLRHDERDVGFDFSVASLQPLHSPRLRYRLHGYDREWRDLPLLAQPHAQYTNLPAGEYRFEVADSAAGVPSATASLAFTLAPRLYETLWFKLLALLVVVLALGGLARLGDRRYRLQQRLLEQQVAQRTGELQRAYARLERISHTDALTGLHNRRHLSEEVPRRLRRLHHGPAGGETRKVVLFALLDIDHFKIVNDTHGHHGGDAVLQEVARRLAQQTRAGDCLARWGGEEFLLVCFEVDAEQSAAIADRLCESIRAEPILADGCPLRITVSMGLVVVPATEAHRYDDWEQIVRTADRALYMAKHEGRDQWRALDAATTEAAPPMHPADTPGA